MRSRVNGGLIFSEITKFNQRSSFSRLMVVLALLCGIFLATHWAPWQDREIALDLGEPWEEMRQRSTAKIGPAFKGDSWFQMPGSDARLRLIDPQYGFVTPLARFFTVSFDNDGNVRSLRMSPQVEPLPLEEILKIVVDLQNQWRAGGWELYFPDEFPAIEDTVEWREHLKDRRGRTFWRGGSRYMIRLYISRFYSNKYDDPRYLITMQLSGPRRD